MQAKRFSQSRNAKPTSTKPSSQKRLGKMSESPESNPGLLSKDASYFVMMLPIGIAAS